jgi:L-fuculose-phosphate aldolase
MDRLGLVSGASGNASMRLPGERGQERYLITPTGLPYGQMTAADLVAVDGDLEPVDGGGIPSTESMLHLAIYRARPDVGSVMHTHSVHATALAVAGRPLPPVVDEMVVYLGGQIEVADYGFPGSEELASAAVRALGDRRAALLRNHGLCGVGATPEEALRVCDLAERLAKIFLLAESAGGALKLPQEAIEAERAAYLMRSGMRESGRQPL